MTKTSSGNFFEDFRLGQTIRHATPRTVTGGRCRALHRAVRLALRGAVVRRVRHGHRLSARADRRPAGVPHRVRQDRAGRLAQRGRQSRLRRLPVPRAGLPGDTLTRNLRGDRAEGELQPQDRHRLCAHARHQAGRHGGARIRALGDGAKARRERRRRRAITCRGCRPRSSRSCSARPARRSTSRPTTSRSPAARTASATTQVGEKIDHVDGITVEEAEHQIATRLYQNTARIHFDQFSAAQGRFGRRLIYGGHVISLARALSFNGLANAFHIAAINGGRHVAPLFAGDTVFAWSEVLAKSELPRPQRCRRAAAAHGRHQGQAVRGFPAQERRRLRSGRAARSRLLGADPALKCVTSRFSSRSRACAPPAAAHRAAAHRNRGRRW